MVQKCLRQELPCVYAIECHLDQKSKNGGLQTSSQCITVPYEQENDDYEDEEYNGSGYGENCTYITYTQQPDNVSYYDDKAINDFYSAKNDTQKRPTIETWTKSSSPLETTPFVAENTTRYENQSDVSLFHPKTNTIPTIVSVTRPPIKTQKFAQQYGFFAVLGVIGLISCVIGGIIFWRKGKTKRSSITRPEVGSVET